MIALSQFVPVSQSLCGSDHVIGERWISRLG
jgi:hypothetical protein